MNFDKQYDWAYGKDVDSARLFLGYLMRLSQHVMESSRRSGIDTILIHPETYERVFVEGHAYINNFLVHHTKVRLDFETTELDTITVYNRSVIEEAVMPFIEGDTVSFRIKSYQSPEIVESYHKNCGGHIKIQWFLGSFKLLK
jgi:hypothetical protein